MKLNFIPRCLLLAAVFSVSAHAAEKKRSAGMLQEDFPFQGACVSAQFPAKNVAMKGLAIRVGTNAAMLFDTDLLRMAAGWTGGYIDTHGVAFDGGHGAHPKIVGEQKFGSRVAPGWADEKGNFADPRPEPFGPLPESWCRWDGLYVNGMDVTLAYTVHGTKIFEQAGSVERDGRLAFTRTFKTEKTKKDLSLLVCEVDGASAAPNNNTVTLTAGTNVTLVSLTGLKDARLEVAEGSRVVARLPKGTAAGTFSVAIWRGPAEVAKEAAQLLNAQPQMVVLDKGGSPHWPKPVITKGATNTSTTPDGAYVTDSITSPMDNPWNRRVRFGGMDFFSDGKRAALCTHDGDIWIVSGIDGSLEKLEWRRFASGQYETLGLAIVDDVIYTSGRDQITRYHDLNKDGEADFYENFNNQIMSTEGFHEFVFDLQTDKAGNFYFAKAAPVNSGGGGFGNGGGNGTVCAHSGCLFKVSKDGRKLEVIATGFRAPNGIGVSAEGQVTTSDNEGTWVPTTPLNWISQPGQFAGVIHKLTPKETAERWTPPLCWLSKQDYDNSGGGQIWVTSDQWGPFRGELLHESYGRSSLFLVLKESIADGRMQGGVVKFPLKFTSSVMRARFNKRDGQLYVAGLSEWQSNAGKITGFDRVRYTGKPVYSVSGLKVVKGGLQLTFTQPLDTASAADTQNFSGKRWNYKRTQGYGSPEVSVEDPDKKARDPLTITGTRLSKDGKTLTVEISDLKPVMQQSLRFNLKAADGTPVAQEIQHTIHAVPDDKRAAL
jgi:glucose/arabinose dehydrogenase